MTKETTIHLTLILLLLAIHVLAKESVNILSIIFIIINIYFIFDREIKDIYASYDDYSHKNLIDHD